MVYHIYDATYCGVISIAICDMLSKDLTTQLVFWKNLNVVMAWHNLSNPKFKGFIGDNAQAYWNAVQIMYGNGDASIPIEDQERTCFFHELDSIFRETYES